MATIEHGSVIERGETRSVPLFPLRNSILFPFVLAPYSAGRPRSIASLEAAVAREDKLLAVVAQKDSSVDEPGLRDLYRYGALGAIRRMARSEETVEAIVQGIERVRVVAVERRGERLEATVEVAPALREVTPETEALQRELIGLAGNIQATTGQVQRVEIHQLLAQIDDPMQLVYLLGSVIGLDSERAQRLLDADTQLEAMKLLHGYLLHERRVAELRKEIAGQAESEMGRQHREYMLRQQLRAIQQELGEQDPERSEAQELRRRLAEAELPVEVRKETERELDRLESIPAVSPEHQVVRAHLELILDLPWARRTEDNLDLARARRILDEDHYDLREIKEVILEHLAVLRLNPEAHAPILCFVGPPGLGKTSLGQSIARSLGRKFERFSLGGLHDEAELRGHRRTYIGAMPGRIIQAIRRAESMNPLLMLDEVDKLGRDFRGDPASALLEILDPAQNHAFRDNYLDLPFDLSRVFFITTANTLDTIPGPLLDRMEILRLSGYSDEEKLEIARRYLVLRQRVQAGLAPEQLQVPDATLLKLIRRWTREAGVRELERMLGRIARKMALAIAEGEDLEGGAAAEPAAPEARAERGNGGGSGEGPESGRASRDKPGGGTGADLGREREGEPGAAAERPAGPRPRGEIVPEDLPDLLGPERFAQEEMRRQLPPGVATGLAWTPTGGDVLYVEAIRLPGDGKLTLTGQLGSVMKESAQAARNWVLSQAERLGVRDPSPGMHIHVPAGAIPKDGPSAGVTIATALASLYTGLAVASDTAMTGEITLTGLVLPVGGIKEKLLAARRAGFKRVILPRRNEKDLSELPESVREDLELVFTERIEEVLKAAIPDLPESGVAAVSMAHASERGERAERTGEGGGGVVHAGSPRARAHRPGA